MKKSNVKESNVLNNIMSNALIDMVPVESQAIVNPDILHNVNATGQIQWKDLSAYPQLVNHNVSNVRWSSGVLISEDLFLTAAHSFIPEYGQPWITPSYQELTSTLAPQKILDPGKLCLYMKVNFNFQISAFSTSSPLQNSETEAKQNETSFDILKMLDYRLDHQYDYAILKLGNTPGGQFGFVTPGFHRINSKESFNVYCIHHPRGSHKQYSQSSRQTITTSQEPTELLHAANTLGGSSGAGIFDKNTHRLLAIHVRGFQEKDLNANKAILMTAIYRVSNVYKKLIQSHPKLKKLYEKKLLKELSKNQLKGAIVGLTAGLLTAYFVQEKGENKHNISSYLKYGTLFAVVGAIASRTVTKSKQEKKKDKEFEKLLHLKPSSGSQNYY